MFRSALEKLLDGLTDKDIEEAIVHAESMARPLPQRAEYEKQRTLIILKPEETGVFQAVRVR